METRRRYHALQALILMLIMLVVFLFPAASLAAQVSISSILDYGASSNLEGVTLEGVVHLKSRGRDTKGCGSYAMTLEDDTGMIDISVRRARRLPPLVEGERVQVFAQIQVVRQGQGYPPKVCVQAREIKRLEVR